MKKKFLCLSLVSFMMVSFLGGCSCKKPDSSSNSESTSYEAISLLTPEDAIKKCSLEVYSDLNKNNDTYVFEDFLVDNEITSNDGTASCTITWKLKIIKGTEDAVSLRGVVGDKTKTNVKIGYLTNKVKEETEFELIPTFEYKGTKMTLQESLGEGYYIRRKIFPLEIDSYESYISKCNIAKEDSSYNPETLVAIRGHIIDISLDKKYVYVQSDDVSRGYLCILGDNYHTLDFKYGDKVIVTGQGFVINNRYAIAEPRINIEDDGNNMFIRPEYADITDIFKNAESISSNDFIPYQNVRVCAKNVTLLGNSDDKFKFSINGKEYVVYLANNYFLLENTLESLKYDYIEGLNADVGGVLLYVKGEYYLVPDSYDYLKINLTNEEKLNYIKDHLVLDGYQDEYSQYGYINLPYSDHFESTFEWNLKNNIMTNVISMNNSRVIIDVSSLNNGDECSAKLVGTIKIGEDSLEITYDIKVKRNI